MQRIRQKKGGAAVDDKGVKYIPVHFFTNGIKVNNQAFYPYFSKEAHEFVKDIFDGFLPGFLRQQF